MSRNFCGRRNPETLAILGKLLKNTVVEPSEEKFRRIRLSNPKIDALVMFASSSISYSCHRTGSKFGQQSLVRLEDDPVRRYSRDFHNTAQGSFGKK